MSTLLLKLVTRSHLRESNIDYPKSELSEDVWAYDPKTKKYTLRQDVEDQIFKVIAAYPNFSLIKTAKEVHITGSIGTNLYDDNTDVDVHIIPNEQYPKGDAQTRTKEIFKWYKENRDIIGGYVGNRPIEIYVQQNPAQEFLSDALYDVNNHRWLKGPLLVKSDYDPYSVYSGVLSDMKGIMGEADKDIGALKRDVIDYDTMKKALAELPADAKAKVHDHMIEKLRQIEEAIEELMATKKEWQDARKLASEPATPEEALKDVKMAREWKDKNAAFKFLSRYEYMRLIGDLEKFMEDEKVSPEEVDQMKGLLGVGIK